MYFSNSSSIGYSYLFGFKQGRIKVGYLDLSENPHLEFTVGVYAGGYKSGYSYLPTYGSQSGTLISLKYSYLFGFKQGRIKAGHLDLSENPRLEFTVGVYAGGYKSGFSYLLTYGSQSGTLISLKYSYLFGFKQGRIEIGHLNLSEIFLPVWFQTRTDRNRAP
jgi:hypothetical protein